MAMGPKLTDGNKGGYIMKIIFRNILAASVLVLSASCAEKQIDVKPNGSDNDGSNLEQMIFSAAIDKGDVISKTTFTQSTGEVLWEASDEISVFSVGETVSKTSFKDPIIKKDGAVAEFSGLAAAADTYYAVYPHSEANAYSEGSLVVNLPAVQTVVAGGFASGSNVSVAASSDKSLQFRNVTSLLGIKFDEMDCAYNTKSITIKAKKNDSEYLGIAGKTQVSFDPETGLPVVGEGDVQSVTLNAPEGGFEIDVTYYVPVYAVGACAGFEVAFTDVDEQTYTKTNSTPGLIARSTLLDFGVIPNPYPEIQLPDEFTFSLSFESGAWPFHNPIASNNTATPESYYYAFAYDSKSNKRKYLEFQVAVENYELLSTGLKFLAAGNMPLPVFNDMYLRTVVVNKAVASRLNFIGQGATGASKFTQSLITYTLYTDKTVYTDGNGNKVDHTAVKAEPGYLYKLGLRDANIVMTKLTLTYSKTSPGTAPTA